MEWKLSGKGVPTLKIVDYKTTSAKPTLEELRLNLQFTIYVYASLQPEFWLGYVEDGWHPPMVQKYAPMVNGAALMERFANAPRRAAWGHLWGGLELDAGSRTEEDFERMYVLLDGVERAVNAGVYIPSIKSSSCKWCPYKPVCRAVVPVLDKMSEPTIEDDEMF
jgi:RecB family exonuclease